MNPLQVCRCLLRRSGWELVRLLHTRAGVLFQHTVAIFPCCVQALVQHLGEGEEGLAEEGGG